MTDARTTQIALEEWSDGNPAARVTQIALEMWAATTAGTVQALMTQIALEQWARPDVIVTPARPRRVQNVNYR